MKIQYFFLSKLLIMGSNWIYNDSLCDICNIWGIIVQKTTKDHNLIPFYVCQNLDLGYVSIILLKRK